MESRIIIWDEAKRQANIAKHGFDFAELTIAFFRSSTIVPAKLDRLSAIGEWKGVTVIVVVFLPLGTEALSVISMRPANRKERRLHDDD